MMVTLSCAPAALYATTIFLIFHLPRLSSTHFCNVVNDHSVVIPLANKYPNYADSMSDLRIVFLLVVCVIQPTQLNDRAGFWPQATCFLIFMLDILVMGLLSFLSLI